jgi:hypothetical protein
MKSAGRIPYVLMLTAQNLCTRSNLCSISNGCLSQDAITSDVTPRADAGLRVSKKRAERDSAGHRTLGRGADDNNQPEDSLRRRMEPSHRIVRRTCRSALCGQNKITPPAAWQQQERRHANISLEFSGSRISSVSVSSVSELPFQKRIHCNLAFRHRLTGA